MVCSLAVPAFAAEKNEYVDAKVIVIAGGKNADAVTENIVEADKITAEKATVESILKKADSKSTAIDLSFKNGKVSKVGTDNGAGALKTGEWVVALNGKIVSEDLSTVAVSEDDVIVVYLYEATFGTKLAQYDASAIAQGIISFYYYDAEGNKQPLTGATVTLSVPDALNLIETVVVAETEAVGETNEYGLPVENVYSSTFKTDEKGQIWIAPQFLAAGEDITIENISIDPVKALTDDDIKKNDYDKDQSAYYDNNRWRNFEGRAIIDAKIETADLYNVAGATGDMTVVYVLVAFAAVATIAAVVVMKKKSVKAN
jgi:hypothetical protein